MSTNKWIELAEDWERKAEEARANGDDSWAAACDEKAWACRANADFAIVEETDGHD